MMVTTSWLLPLLFCWSARGDDGTTLERAVIDQAVDVIEASLGEQVDRGTLYRAAIAGMARQLDGLTGGEGNRVLTQRQYDDLQAWSRGRRHGIGVEFSIIPAQGLLMTDVLSGGAAERAGLQPGDLVVAMDNHPLTGLSAATIHDITQADSSPQVILDVRRQGGKLRRMTLTRGWYQLVPVVSAQDGAHPFVRVGFFGEGAARGLAQVLAGLDQGQTVALDLRDTTGGLLDEVVAAADLFLPPGAVVLSRVLADGSLEPRTVSGERVWAGSVVILANRGTAGVAEAFVAALQEHRVALVVGTPTAGLTTIPSYHPLADDLILQLADTTMQSPGGASWAGEGVAPDVLVEPMDLSMGLRPGQPPLDLQRDAAIRLMSDGR